MNIALCIHILYTVACSVGGWCIERGKKNSIQIILILYFETIVEIVITYRKVTVRGFGL